MLQLQDLKLFRQIVATGSISAAARQFDLTPAAASASLKRLELYVETPLIIRSTRSLKLTSAGERFLQHCQNALTALEQGSQELKQQSGRISGELRLAAPSDLGRNLLLPWLDALQDQHAELRIRLELSDKIAGLAAEQVDVALRYGSLPDSNQVSFHIADVPRVLCASPDYLATYGKPSHPIDLQQHNCLLYLIDQRTFANWHFGYQDDPFSVSVSGNRVSNDAEIVRRWAVSGKGIALKSMLDMSEDLRAGHVVSLLSEFKLHPQQLNLVCASRAQVSPTVILLRDELRLRVARQLALVVAVKNTTTAG